nr:uncharacterized protein LOC112281753 isoform X3 [Physcomitrium patens]|eukprot:XP_024374382.1 uncharacterized protein LOC112281753 isoform X3 [Physcomitrella patens]
MAIAIFLIPLYIGFLIVLCSAPLADSRAVFFAAKYEASVADEFGIDEGPATFTMQDHLNFLFSTTQCRVGSLVFSGSWSTEFDQRKGIGETKDKWHGNRVNGSITSLGIRRRGRAPL